MGNEPKIFIEEVNTPGGGIASVSLLPVEGCRHTAPCRNGDCQALAWRSINPAVWQAWKNNLDIASNDLETYQDQIGEYLEKHKPKRFRWHVAGDILSRDYFHAMCYLALENRNTEFLCFTKQYEMVNCEWFHRNNLKLILSIWPGHPYTNLKNLPLAFMQDGTDGRVPAYARECSGNCDDCFDCWDLHRGEAVYFFKRGEEKESRARKKALEGMPQRSGERQDQQSAAVEDNPRGIDPMTGAPLAASTGNEIKGGGHFVAYQDGTVLDTRTSLMWAAKDNGANIEWQSAKQYCESYRGGGYTDWRMPTQDELAGLYKVTRPKSAGKKFETITVKDHLTGNCTTIEVKDNLTAAMYGVEKPYPEENGGTTIYVPGREPEGNDCITVRVEDDSTGDCQTIYFLSDNTDRASFHLWACETSGSAAAGFNTGYKSRGWYRKTCGGKFRVRPVRTAR